MRTFFIEPAAAAKSEVIIEGSQAHHIKNVLRLKPGDQLKLCDGTGGEYEAIIRNMDAESVDVDIQRRLRSTPEMRPRISVAQAFLKEKKMDDLVRKLSELGISDWLPFFPERSVARPDGARLAGRIHRWQRIAAEAMKQCRRKTILNIHEPYTFEKLLQITESCDLKIVFWEGEAVPFDANRTMKNEPPPQSIVIMLGPEGGFAPQEIDAVRQSGFLTAGMGPRILRAETAAIAASTLVQYLFGDMGPKPVTSHNDLG
jgi:16S rRNA (uracil1498-N3)-methyltransferase